jgi:cysteine desulfurase
MGLDLEGVSASSGSACMVGSIQPSHVLLAMGIPAPAAMASVRFSLGNTTSESDILHTIRAVRKVLSLQHPAAP